MTCLKRFSLLFFLTALPTIAFSQVDQDDLLLEQRLLSISGEIDRAENAETFLTTHSLSVGELKGFTTSAKGKASRCADVQKTVFAKKYVLTTDAEGKPCRIYDLSFPNLKTMFSSRKAMKVPVQHLKSRDYLNWLDGNLTGVELSQQQFKKTFNARAVAKKSWVSKLKFRNRPQAVPGSQVFSSDIGLPQSFLASDLDIGRYFEFDAKTKADLQSLLVEVAGPETLASDYFMQVLNKPETFLKAIKFNWNDAEKVYDVILSGEFLPLKPVALVDYQLQYKYVVEKMFRSLLASGLTRLTQLIPTPIIASAVEVLITDAFEQMDLAYEYQMLQLEDTLRTVDSPVSARALNVLYGQRADIFSAVVMSAAQGKPFDLQAIEKMGRTARYTNEKQRDIMMSKMNSKLVLEKQCQNEFVHNYFVICSKNGKAEGLYSLISQHTVFNKNFGPALIYRYDRPYETTLKRGGAWLLSAGLRIASLPISKNLVSKLNSILKDYMKAGLLDEAHLRNSLFMGQPSVNQVSTDIHKWLYIQNLNIFLPKSKQGEDNVISANKTLLGVTEAL